ncbi:MAG: OmpA family protein [Myxococcales bacterium]|nr:OmpA family protein [Myxococcales bacterium]
MKSISKRFAAVAAATVTVAGAGVSVAQTSDRLQVQQFRPMPGQQSEYLHVPRAATPDAGRWELGLTFNYARNPLVIQTIRQNDRSRRTGVIIRSQDTFDFLGMFAITNWLSLGVDVPLYVYDAPGDSGQGFERFEIGDSAHRGIGDVRLVPKLQLVQWGGEDDELMTLGLSVDFLLPTAAHPEQYQGESFRVEPRLAWDYVPRDWVTWTLFGGVLARPEQSVVDNISAGSSVTFGTGAMFRLDRLERVFVVPEVVGLVSIAKGDNVDLEEVPLEFRAALRYFPIPGLMVEGGGGGGIIEGYGTPDWRLLAGVSYSNGPAADLTCQSTNRFPDDDADGVCETPEAFAGECDICRPRLDGDFPELVEIPDYARRDDAAHYWRTSYYVGADTNDGIDADGDGWPDACDICRPQDACDPLYRTNDNEDSDGDGIPDGCDRCPDGGDLADIDGDCIVDCLDECPEQPETWNNVDDADGCPETDWQCSEADVCPENLDVFPFVDEAYGGVPFFFDYDVFAEFSERTMNGYDRETNEALLDQIAIIVQALEPCLRYELRAEGHTDTDGNPEYNVWLGLQRANRVMQGLVDRGVNPDLLSASTFGESDPLNPDSQTDDYAPGNRENRRVILRIVGCTEQGERPPETFEPVCSEPHGFRCGE